MAKRSTEDEKVDTGRWLLTYSDIMNNLLVLFVVLYAMSLIDLEKFKALANQFNSTLGGGGSATSQSSNYSADVTSDSSAASQESNTSTANTESASQNDQFDEVYNKVTEALKEKGYEDDVIVEKGEGYIHFRFKDSVLFLPDSSTMKEEGYDILQYVGSTIFSIDDLVQSIEIDGHTAQVGEDTSSDFFSWELSSDRAITVLKFLVQRCSLSQSKMTVSGYSHYDPIGDNSTEEGKSVNRRVEIRITRVEGS